MPCRWASAPSTSCPRRSPPTWPTSSRSPRTDALGASGGAGGGSELVAQVDAEVLGHGAVALLLRLELVLERLQHADLGEHLLLRTGVEAGGFDEDVAVALRRHASRVLRAQLGEAVVRVEDLADLVEVEAHDRLELADAPHALAVRLGVAARAAGAVAGRRHQSQRLVAAQRARRHAELLRDLADAIQPFAVRHAGTHSSGNGVSPSTSGPSSSGAPNGPVSSSAMYCAPRIHDAHAATRHMISDAVNAMRSPSMNGSEMRSGKNFVPVMSAALSGGNDASVCLPTSVSIGL